VINVPLDHIALVRVLSHQLLVLWDSIVLPAQFYLLYVLMDNFVILELMLHLNKCLQLALLENSA